ncbi:hypothetical protein EDB85DRAFT_1899198 [Lactarius pseudohatsudake]|nr:hypothetical protein EDB85DRAFT_1899198 [Lactarius pseudohatsudake]
MLQVDGEPKQELMMTDRGKVCSGGTGSEVTLQGKMAEGWVSEVTPMSNEGIEMIFAAKDSTRLDQSRHRLIQTFLDESRQVTCQGHVTAVLQNLFPRLLVVVLRWGGRLIAHRPLLLPILSPPCVALLRLASPTKGLQDGKGRDRLSASSDIPKKEGAKNITLFLSLQNGHPRTAFELSKPYSYRTMARENRGVGAVNVGRRGRLALVRPFPREGGATGWGRLALAGPFTCVPHGVARGKDGAGGWRALAYGAARPKGAVDDRVRGRHGSSPSVRKRKGGTGVACPLAARTGWGGHGGRGVAEGDGERERHPRAERGWGWRALTCTLPVHVRGGVPLYTSLPRARGRVGPGIVCPRVPLPACTGRRGHGGRGRAEGDGERGRRAHANGKGGGGGGTGSCAPLPRLRGGVVKRAREVPMATERGGAARHLCAPLPRKLGREGPGVACPRVYHSPFPRRGGAVKGEGEGRRALVLSAAKGEREGPGATGIGGGVTLPVNGERRRRRALTRMGREGEGGGGCPHAHPFSGRRGQGVAFTVVDTYESAVTPS